MSHHEADRLDRGRGDGCGTCASVAEEISGACLVAVSDFRAEQASRIAKGARVYADPLELINSPDVDAVVIASPDATHAAFTRACISKRKRVLVEKPLAAIGWDQFFAAAKLFDQTRSCGMIACAWSSIGSRIGGLLG